MPVTCARFTPSSEASLRTRGVTYASAGCETGADETGAGGGVTGAATTGATATATATGVTG